jgi:hypothetical protein
LEVVFSSELLPRIDPAFTGAPQSPKCFAETSDVKTIAAVMLMKSSKRDRGPPLPALAAREIRVDCGMRWASFCLGVMVSMT